MDDKERHAYTNYLTIMAVAVRNLPGYSQVPQTVGSAINTPASLNRALSSRYSQMRWDDKSRSCILLFPEKRSNLIIRNVCTYIPHWTVPQLRTPTRYDFKQETACAQTSSVDRAAHYIYHENRNTSNQLRVIICSRPSGAARSRPSPYAIDPISLAHELTEQIENSIPGCRNKQILHSCPSLLATSVTHLLHTGRSFHDSSEHGSFIAQNACLHRDIPRQLRRSGRRENIRSL